MLDMEHFELLRYDDWEEKMNFDKKIATRSSFGEALKELGDRNENIVVLDADLSGATKTNSFAKAHPDRFFDMGIAENNMIGVASRNGFMPEKFHLLHLLQFLLWEEAMTN